VTTDFDRRFALDPRVALRPEPFGALAYHYGNRKLLFLKHPDIVRVVRTLDGDHTLAAALRACDIDERRWPSFATALSSLTDSEMLYECEPVTAG
jgi:putative mycofactocin binding protein MftB